MNIQSLIDSLKKSNELSKIVQKHTLVVNEKSETQGALFFIPIGSKEYKVLIPAPFHLDLLNNEEKTSYSNVLRHKEALLLK